MSVADDNAATRREEDRLFDETKIVGDAEVVLSPSGRHRLTIREYATGQNTWSFSRGTVVRVADDTVVCDLRRNYGMFHHSFVTKDGRDFLITGRSYMSQTIVDLDRGTEYEPPGDHFDGSAFCWVKCFLSPDGTTLAVDGCIWACPYELRFFDFTDPATGWPELRVDTLEAPSDARPPAWLDARTIDVHQHDRDKQPHERTRLERKGDEMVVLEHWLSEEEHARRAEAARRSAELDAWWATFRASDPMYRRLVELVRSHALPGDTLEGRPGAHKIVQYFRRADPKASADLQWDIDSATIRVQRYDAAGSRAQDLVFAGTLEGIEAAIAMIAAVFA